MITINEKQLKLEIAHIFDSGANAIRVLEMVKNYINTRNQVSENESISNVVSCFDIDFGGNVKAGVDICNNKIKTVRAMDGWGNGISSNDILIIEVE